MSNACLMPEFHLRNILLFTYLFDKNTMRLHFFNVMLYFVLFNLEGVQMKKQISMILAALVLSFSFNSANAAMVSTTSLLQGSQQISNSESVTTMRLGLSDALVNYGVAAQDADSRVALLTNDQVVMLNGQLADMPAGGNILGLAVLVFLVFIITDAVGATDVFTFVDPIK